MLELRTQLVTRKCLHLGEPNSFTDCTMQISLDYKGKPAHQGDRFLYCRGLNLGVRIRNQILPWGIVGFQRDHHWPGEHGKTPLGDQFLPSWSTSWVLGQIPPEYLRQHYVPTSMQVNSVLCTWDREHTQVNVIWLCDRWTSFLFSLYVQLEHTSSINEILQECGLMIIERKTVKCSAY